MTRRKRPNKPEEWEPLVPATRPYGELIHMVDAVMSEMTSLNAIADKLGIQPHEVTRVQVKKLLEDDEMSADLWMNHIYTVSDYGWEQVGDMEIRHLSFKRNDRKPVTDWRHKQYIKNQLCGEECEACELFPAESRLVDGANQYHLWVLREGTYFPFGFFEGRVVNNIPLGKGKQRPDERYDDHDHDSD